MNPRLPLQIAASLWCLVVMDLAPPPPRPPAAARPHAAPAPSARAETALVRFLEHEGDEPVRTYAGSLFLGVVLILGWYLWP